ncbi:dynein regulatory complex subunit 3 isoform X3 [Tamandua tetradactyla]
MSRLGNSMEPRVLDDDLLKLAVSEQGPREEAGQLAKQEGILFKDVLSLQLDFQNILRIDNLWPFESLRKLQLDNNVIEKIEGLESLTRLVWLDLSFNNIETIEGLDTLVNLEDLSLFNNRISKIDSLDALTKLQVLSLGNNQIYNMLNVIYLRRFKDLRTLSLSGNPISESEDYKMSIYAYLPDLTYLDFRRIDEHAKELAEAKHQYTIDELRHRENLAQAKQEDEQARREELEEHKGCTATHHSRLLVIQALCGSDCRPPLWRTSTAPSCSTACTQRTWRAASCPICPASASSLRHILPCGSLLPLPVNLPFLSGPQFLHLTWDPEKQSPHFRGSLGDECYNASCLTVGEIGEGQVCRHLREHFRVRPETAGEAEGGGRHLLPVRPGGHPGEPCAGQAEGRRIRGEALPGRGSSKESPASQPQATLKILSSIREESELPAIEMKMVECGEDITQLFNELMSLEMQLVEQLEETINFFERSIIDLVGLFIENVQSLMAQCRDLENHHHEKLLEISINTLEKILKGELDEDLPDHVRALFVDKDTLVGAVGASHDMHLLRIDNREDALVTRANAWCTRFVDKIHQDETRRNRERVKEITQYIDHMQNELDSLEFGDVLD